MWTNSNKYIKTLLNELEMALDYMFIGLQTNSYHWKKNCAGSLADIVGYSHLNLLRAAKTSPLACSSSTLLLRLGTLRGACNAPHKLLTQFPSWIDRKCSIGIALEDKTQYNSMWHTLVGKTWFNKKHFVQSYKFYWILDKSNRIKHSSTVTGSSDFIHKQDLLQVHQVLSIID